MNVPLSPSAAPGVVPVPRNTRQDGDDTETPAEQPPVLCRWCRHPIYPSPKFKHDWLHSPSAAGRRTCCNGLHRATPDNTMNPS